MEREELFRILEEMPIQCDEIRRNIYDILANNSTPGNISVGLSSIFNYGYIMGKREERAKKRPSTNT